MANTPVLKIYSPSGKYVASCKYREDAAILVGHYPAGARVRLGHSGPVLWHEGYEEHRANESYDDAARIMGERWKLSR